MGMFNSPFEKLSTENQQRMVAAVEITAVAVSKGGGLFEVFSKMLTTLKQIEQNTRASKGKKGKEGSGSGGGVKDAIMMRIIGAKALTGIGKGLGVIADSLKKFGKPKETLEQMQAIATGITLLEGVGKSIFNFAKWLVLSAPLLMIGAIVAPLIGTTLVLILSTLVLVGKIMPTRKLLKTFIMLRMVGKGIFMFGAYLALSLLVYPYAIKALPMVAGVILGIGLVFFLLDKLQIDRSMRKTSIALGFAGLSILALGLSIALFSALMNTVDDPWNTLALVGAVVLGVALSFALVGYFAMPIFKGALVMAIVGISLLILTPGIYALSKIVDGMSLEQIGYMALLVGGLGAAFGVIGLAAPYILLGSVAMISVGVALLSLGAGLKMLSNVFKSGGIDTMLADSGQVTEGFLGIGGGRKMSKMEWLLQSLAYSFSINPIRIASMYASAPALILSGVALVSIAKGIKKFQDIAESTDLQKLGDNVATITGTLADKFGELGTKFPGGRKSLFNRIFGGGSQSPVADGISSVMGMGDALTSIAIGMQQMANLRFPTKYDKNGKAIEFETMSSDAPQKVADNTSMIVDSLATVFGKIGDDPKLGKGGRAGFFSRVFGAGGQSPVADGVSSVMGMGDALTGVALGFQSMADLKFPTQWDKNGKAIKFETIDIKSAAKKVLENTSLILLGENGTGGLVGMFTSIGKANGPDGGWFTSTEYETGVKMIQGIGEPIKNLAEGVSQMAQLRFANKWDKNGKAIGWTSHADMPKKLKQVEANIKQILLGTDGTGGLVGIFKKLGGEDDGGWFSKSSIDKGANIAKLISRPIKDIASAAAELMSDKWSPEGASERIGAIIKALAQGSDTLDAKGLLTGSSNPLEATATYLKTIAEHTSKFQDYTKAFTTYVSDFVKYKDAVNDFDPDKLELTTDMFQGLSYLAKTENAIENMSEQLAAAIYKLADMIESTGGMTSTGNATPPEGTPATQQSSTTGSKVDMSAVVKAIEMLESRLDEPITVKTGSSNWFS